MKNTHQDKARITMALSMLDQILFPLACKHAVVLGRLQGKSIWICEICERETNLLSAPLKDRLEKDLDTAHQIDLQEMAKGQTIERGWAEPHCD
jgi:hypothetical protein